MKKCKICEDCVELEIVPDSHKIVKVKDQIFSVASFVPKEHGLCYYHRKMAEKLLSPATMEEYSKRDCSILHL